MNVSFLSTLMNGVEAKSASLFRFLYAQDDVVGVGDNDDDDDDDDDGNNNIGNYVLFDDLWEMDDIAGLVADRPIVVPTQLPPPPEMQEEEDNVSSQKSTQEHMVDKVPCASTEE